jgi:hypothetical protein
MFSESSDTHLHELKEAHRFAATERSNGESKGGCRSPLSVPRMDD